MDATFPATHLGVHSTASWKQTRGPIDVSHLPVHHDPFLHRMHPHYFHEFHDMTQEEHEAKIVEIERP